MRTQRKLNRGIAAVVRTSGFTGLYEESILLAYCCNAATEGKQGYRNGLIGAESFQMTVGSST